MKKALVLLSLMGAVCSSFAEDSLVASSATSSNPLVLKIDTNRILSFEAPANQALRAFVEAPQDKSLLAGKRIAILSTDGVEEIELMIPLNAFRAMGATVDVISPKEPQWQAFGVVNPKMRANHILTVNLMQNSGWVAIDRFISDVSVDEYDAFIVPGGAWNPDILRCDKDALALLKQAFEAGKPVAAVCHGPQVLMSAGIVQGKKATVWWAAMGDLANAGATVLDQAVVVDGNLITSRSPLDLPDFINAIVAQLK